MRGERLRQCVVRYLRPAVLIAGIGLLPIGCGSVPGSMPGSWIPSFGESNTNSRAFKKKVEADRSIPDADEVFGL